MYHSRSPFCHDRRRSETINPELAEGPSFHGLTGSNINKPLRGPEMR